MSAQEGSAPVQGEPTQTDQDTRSVSAAPEELNGQSQPKLIRFYTPSQCRAYVPPADHQLAGDCHLTRGSVCVLAGPPGVGKSRAATALAVAGATPGSSWFGLRVHCQFRTVVIQNENSLFRLSKEYAILTDPKLDDYILTSEPPPLGLRLENLEFRRELVAQLRLFKPSVGIFDPWNSLTIEDNQRHYLEALRLLKEILLEAGVSPAILIIAHTRKPKEEKSTGRSLLNEIAGSYVLASVARSVFVMQPASDDTTDERIVWYCVKNNDGVLGERSVWKRHNGLFLPCEGVEAVVTGTESQPRRRSITKEDLELLFKAYGKMTRQDCVKRLMDLTKLKHGACCNALKEDGRFAAHLRTDDEGLLFWAP